MEKESKTEFIEFKGALITPDVALRILTLQYGVFDPKQKKEIDKNGAIDAYVKSIDDDINWLILKRHDIAEEEAVTLLDVMEQLSDYRYLLLSFKVPEN